MSDFLKFRVICPDNVTLKKCVDHVEMLGYKKWPKSASISDFIVQIERFNAPGGAVLLTYPDGDYQLAYLENVTCQMTHKTILSVDQVLDLKMHNHEQH